MELEYIVVQAGGKGTRMDKLTRNKPKALVPVHNLPMLFHLFRRFPTKKFLIIGDYKIDVLRKYLAAFADVDYEVIDASGGNGTCSGIVPSLERIPDNSPFMLIWSDLVLSDKIRFDTLTDGNYVGLSGDFRCRWKFENNVFDEEPSFEYGVAGMFLFTSKAVIDGVPENGEFVRWLSGKDISFDTIRMDGAKEYGLISEYKKLKVSKCRPFNKLVTEDDKVVKTGIDDQGRALAVREKAWYRKVQTLGFRNIPEIFSYEPLTMELIDGSNIYEYKELASEDKKAILDKLVTCLKKLHSYGSCDYDDASFYDAYLGKTFARLEKIRELVPFADRETVVINGVECPNVFFCKDKLEEMFAKFRPRQFVLLHGDCTFSNIVLKYDTEPILIDPRGYFGTTELYGDVAYDWAKLYYSINGNYDLFNLKQFSLEINENDVSLDIESSGWEELSDYYLELISDDVTGDQIKAIHAIIWLSLTTYAWEDYDSICGAFYNGLLHLKEIL